METPVSAGRSEKIAKTFCCVGAIPLLAWDGSIETRTKKQSHTSTHKTHAEATATTQLTPFSTIPSCLLLFVCLINLFVVTIPDISCTRNDLNIIHPFIHCQQHPPRATPRHTVTVSQNKHATTKSTTKCLFTPTSRGRSRSRDDEQQRQQRQQGRHIVTTTRSLSLPAAAAAEYAITTSSLLLCPHSTPSQQQ